MTTVTLQKAQAELGDLLIRAEAGEEIVIERENLPALRLVVTKQVEKVGRRPGALAHLRGTIPDSFFDPLTEEELRDWEDGPIFPVDKS